MDRQQLTRDILSNPIFEESIQELKDQLLADWRNTTNHDTQGREQLWLELRLIDKVYNHLTTVLEEGTVNEYAANLKEI